MLDADMANKIIIKKFIWHFKNDTLAFKNKNKKRHVRKLKKIKKRNLKSN